MVVGELSRNFKGEYTIGPASSPSFASVCGTYAPGAFLKLNHHNMFIRFFKSKWEVVDAYQKPALFLRILSISCFVAGVAAAAGWVWSSRIYQRNILQELEDEEEEDVDGIEDLDPSLDEPVTPSASGAGGRGGNSLPCVVCFERKRRVVCNPCRHFALCVECARRTWDANGRCPCCRADLDGFSKVFLA